MTYDIVICNILISSFFFLIIPFNSSKKLFYFKNSREVENSTVTAMDI